VLRGVVPPSGGATLEVAVVPGEEGMVLRVSTGVVPVGKVPVVPHVFIGVESVGIVELVVGTL